MTIDILRFVGSPDVRQHMRDIGYQPSTPEAAFLVWHCHDATLQERFAAWEQIVATMPNCGYQTKRLEIEIPDFHDFLHRYIALQKRLLENFKKPDGCLFIPGLRACQRAGGESWGLYDTFERCVTAVVEDARESRCLAGSHDGCCPEMCPGGSFQDDVYERYIVKRRIDDGDGLGEDECSINAAGEVLRLDCRSGLSDDEVNLDMAFCEMLFKFPLPFHAGDILFDWHIRRCAVCADRGTLVRNRGEASRKSVFRIERGTHQGCRQESRALSCSRRGRVYRWVRVRG